MDYDHFIAVDWAQRNMAIARMTGKSNDIVSTIDVPSSVKMLREYLKELRGKKILTLEETNTAQWLYTELKDSVDDLLICDPYRNRLLSEGPKTDRIDAKKLVRLLKAGLLKPVFHSGDEFIYLRRLVSGYRDLIQRGVRLKNQRDATFRSNGVRSGEGQLHPADEFVVSGLDRAIEEYEDERHRYKGEFTKLCRRFPILKHLKQIPGIGEIGAVKTATTIVDPKRFSDKGAFLSYCGLVRLDRISGGKSYGSKKPRYSHVLKEVFKTAALINISSSAEGYFKDYYDYLITEKGYAVFNARHAVARRIAIITYGVLKSGKPFNIPRKVECNDSD